MSGDVTGGAASEPTTDQELLRPRSAEPISVTDEEVVALAGRRTTQVAAVGRLRKLVPSSPIGKVRSSRLGPVAVTYEELLVMRRGAKSRSFIARVPPSEAGADAASYPLGEQLAGPTEVPPGPSSPSR